jgi:hypothetical protein
MTMRKKRHYADFYDTIEYFGNTEVKRVRRKGNTIIRRDWFVFDSVDEAMTFFNEM